MQPQKLPTNFRLPAKPEIRHSTHRATNTRVHVFPALQEENKQHPLSFQAGIIKYLQNQSQKFQDNKLHFFAMSVKFARVYVTCAFTAF